MAELNFDTTGMDLEHDEFAPLPVGKYQAVIAESDVAQNKNGTGRNLKLMFQIINGKYENRKIYVYLALDNPNETAVKIAQKNLGKIIRACGFEKISDSHELHDKPLCIEVGIQEDKSGNYGPSNIIKNYYALGSINTQTAPTSQSAKSFPWSKK